MFDNFPKDRLTQALLLLLTVGVWGLLLHSLLQPGVAESKGATVSARFDTVSVRRLDIVDENGRTRLLLGNSSRFPDFEFHGRKFKRSIKDAAGMVFFDGNGEENGGLVFAKLGDDDIANLTFDFTYQPTDGIRIIKRESVDGKNWSAGFNILDRRPYTPGQLESSQGVQRISLEDDNQDARLIISDAEGHPRIRIGVDKAGQPSIEMLNTEGRPTYRAGEK
jgi:hypothetical protein